MKRIYIDTEYMYDDMFREERMPKETDQKQIIQIAAILFDVTTGTELESLNLLVKPIFHDTLPPFFIKLTNITNNDVSQNGLSFPHALRKLKNFCKEYPIWTFNNDYAVLRQNCAFHNIPNPFKKPFVRVQPLLSNFNINPTKYSSGTLHKAVNVFMQGHVHNALHDVRSMALAMYILEKTKLKSNLIFECFWKNNISYMGF